MVTSTALAVSAASAVPIMPVSRGLPMALLAVLACLLAGALVLLERRICVPALVCDAMPDAGAGLISGWLMHLMNRGLYHELERSSRLARRKWLLSLPLCGHGWQTLVSRAILVHLRRFEGLGDILLLPASTCPCCARSALGCWVSSCWFPARPQWCSTIAPQLSSYASSVRTRTTASSWRVVWPSPEVATWAR